jgi:CRISPR/Cas system CSM-associated protein Csm3 (group 7 of RAMP superfamily)
MTNSPQNKNYQANYELISLPQSVDKKRPAGIDAYKEPLLTGNIALRLKAETEVFVSSGIIAMNQDVAHQTRRIPLVKTAIWKDNIIVIPGSSLKGVVRSIYEAITCSCLCKVTKGYKDQGKQYIKINVADDFQECKIDIKKQEKQKVCPACRIFGAMGWIGLIRFTDAVCEQKGCKTDFVPSLREPDKKLSKYYDKDKDQDKKVNKRKFYYLEEQSESQEKRGIDVQQAKSGNTFQTELHFMNLSLAELGTLFIVLGQDKNNRLFLKVGGGKGVGRGTMTVEVTQVEKVTGGKTLSQRYSSYELSGTEIIKGNKLENFINEAIEKSHNKKLVQIEQLEELKKVLGRFNGEESQTNK